MSPALAVIALAFGIVLLLWGGDMLVRGAVIIAKQLSVPALLVGLTVVAFGTSAPELALNVVAATKGNDGLSFGNVVGSNIANVGLILGIAALYKPLYMSSSVVKRELPLMLAATALLYALIVTPIDFGAGLTGIGAGTVTLAGVVEMGEISRLDGVFLLIGFTATVAAILHAGFKNRDVREKFEEEASELAQPDDDRPAGAPLIGLGVRTPGRIVLAFSIVVIVAVAAATVAGLMTPTEAAIAAAATAAATFARLELSSSLVGAVLSVAVGLAALVLGGNLTENGASTIARTLGMTDELIGITVVAVATSLPELATSLQAVRRGNIDIAVGNVVGSNIFNILLVMGATAAVGPVGVPADGWVALIVMGLLSVLLVPMATIRGRSINRFEAATLLLIYVAFMVYAVVTAPTNLERNDAPEPSSSPASTASPDPEPLPKSNTAALAPASSGSGDLIAVAAPRSIPITPGLDAPAPAGETARLETAATVGP